jgi:hypothetical protein
LSPLIVGVYIVFFLPLVYLIYCFVASTELPDVGRGSAIMYLSGSGEIFL